MVVDPVNRPDPVDKRS